MRAEPEAAPGIVPRAGGPSAPPRNRECLPRLIVIALAFVFMAGCAAKRRAQRVSGAEQRLRHVKVDGNEALPDKEIEPYLQSTETQWFPLPELHYVNPGILAADAERIETLYQRRGFHDAKVTSYDVEAVRDDKVADVAFAVEEGQPTTVESIDFHWPEGPPGGPPDRKAGVAKIETRCGLELGAPFDVEEMHASESTMAQALAERGYAFAEVEARAEVDRDLQVARVDFELRPGPYVHIGQIAITGLVNVPERAVRTEVESYEGKRYAPSRIERLESAVYALNVFESVSVSKASEPRDGKLDLTVEVRESDPQLVKVGVGLGLEPNRWEQYAEVRYRHANLFRTMASVDTRLRIGYAQLPALYRPQEHGPVGRFEPRLRKKGFLEKNLVWTLQPGIELGIQEGYQFYAPTNRAGVSRFFTRFFELGLSHNTRYVDFFNTDTTLDRSRSILGLDYRDPYLLSFLELEARVRLTDRLVDPRNGVEIGARYDIAGGVFGGMFDYQRVTPEVIGRWMPLEERLQFAARAQVGFIFPFGDEPGAPFDLKYYLGGSSTVRGWGLRRLSPRVDDCAPDGSCRSIPVGGNTSVLGNFETRVRVWKKLWAVAFFDAGDVQSGVRSIDVDAWNYSAGPGLRYDSRIGTFRVDLGVRLNDPARFAGEPRVAVHFGLGEAF